MSDLQSAKAALDELLEEENHLRRLHNVFGSGDGPAVLNWILEYCGVWNNRAPADDRGIGRLEAGRYIFNQVALADPEIAHELISKRRIDAEAQRKSDRQAAEAKLKQIKEGLA